jgi:uncharacterized protein YndB with AHSA1/START domain
VNEVRFSVDLRCPPAHAFQVFTDRVDGWWPQGHRRIPGSTLRCTPGRGGALVERGPDGRELILGRVTEWAPPRAIAFEWLLGAPPEAPTSVTVSFEDLDAGTRVTVVHREGARPLPDWSRTVALFERGWNAVLTALQVAVENP